MIYRGIEAEGPERGQKTLFIKGGDYIASDLFKETLWKTGICRFYFGARESFSLPLNIEELISVIFDYCPDATMLFETNSIEEVYKLPDWVRALFCVVFVLPIEVEVVKIVSKEKRYLNWIELQKQNGVLTILDDELYSKDIEVVS